MSNNESFIENLCDIYEDAKNKLTKGIPLALLTGFFVSEARKSELSLEDIKNIITKVYIIYENMDKK